MKQWGVMMLSSTVNNQQGALFLSIYSFFSPWKLTTNTLISNLYFSIIFFLRSLKRTILLQNQNNQKTNEMLSMTKL